jgi:hypothetical protein
MKIISRVNAHLLNSRNTATMRELEKLFQTAPNLAAKTIRLFPQHSISFLTEGLGEIYDIKEKSDSFVGLNDKAYKWKIRGHQTPKVKFATRVTGGAIGTGSTLGGNGTEFIIAFQSSYYNPYDIIKLEDGTLLFVVAGPVFIKEGTFEYTVKINTNRMTETVNTNLLQLGKESGPAGVAYPELSDKGYISTNQAMEEHINYLTKVRYDWSWSADAAATKYIIEDIVTHNGKNVKFNYITDELFRAAMETFHFRKEMQLIYGRSTMDANGRCFLQDPKTGQDIIEGDGLIAQMADSQKQTYSKLTIDLIEDALSDLSLRSPKRTGNVWMLTTGAEGYKEFGKLMRAEHKASWTLQPNSYVQTKNGKIQLGAEYNAYTFQGNTVVVNVNNVFDHPANVSEKGSDGKPLESSKFLFIDMSTYDGVKNIQMIAKDGRSFITGHINGVGGQDGKTSGEASSTLDGSSKVIIGTLGVVMHNPYSSMMLEKKQI